MGDDARRIALRFGELRRFCGDVALLLRTSESLFLERGWTAAQTDSYALGATSGSLGTPERWIPLRFLRAIKHPQHPKALAFIAVLIDLPIQDVETTATTVVTAGVLSYEQANGWKGVGWGTTSALFRWHLHRQDRVDDGSLSWHASPFAWLGDKPPRPIEKGSRKVSKAATLAVPIDEITDPHALETRLVIPVDRIARST
jgi:hypothetical protein